MKKIAVIVKRPDSKPYKTNISDSLENLQRLVGGYIETVTMFKDMVIICNEEGRIKGLQHNCNVCGVDFVGDIVFAGARGEEFCDIPVSFKEFKKAFPELWEEDEGDTLYSR